MLLDIQKIPEHSQEPPESLTFINIPPVCDWRFLTNPGIKKFTIDALDKADPLFWVAPSSSTGKYHPPEDNGEGGLVVHVVKAVAVAEQFARRAYFNELEEDMAYASVILHDVCKNGIPWKTHTDYTHGLIAAKLLNTLTLEPEYAKNTIINAVRFHMAPWCYAISPYEKKTFTRDEMMNNMEELTRALVAPSRIELAVREADYWSTRENMSFYPGLNIVHDTPEDFVKRVEGLYKNQKPQSL